MNYTVIWLNTAQEMLAEVWSRAADPNAVTQATYRLDRAIAEQPLNVGESRDANRRIAFDPPIQILFRVFAADKRVEMISVGAFGR